MSGRDIAVIVILFAISMGLANITTSLNAIAMQLNAMNINARTLLEKVDE